MTKLNEILEYASKQTTINGNRRCKRPRRLRKDFRVAASFRFKNIVLTNTNNDIYYKNIINTLKGTVLNVSNSDISVDRLSCLNLCMYAKYPC